MRPLGSAWRCLATVLVVVGLLSGCTVGPNYRRPEVIMPADWRNAPEQRDSLGDLGWWDIFQDPALHELLSTAVVANRNVQVAVARALESRAQLGVARAAQFPQVNAGASYQYTRPNSENGPFLNGSRGRSPFTGDDFETSVDLVFELDLWGRLRRATEAARAELLASEENRRAVLPVPALAALRSTGNGCRRRCPRGCRRRCSSAGPTFARPNRRSSAPTPESVWPRRNTSQRSRSQECWASRACRCPTSSPGGHGFGRSVPP